MYNPTPTELRVLQPRQGTVVVEVLGEHDVASRAETAATFARLVAENELVVVDVTQTAFIDSSYLKNLATAQRVAHERGSSVLLQVGTEPIVKRLLEVSNFLTHFDHVSSREEALAWAPPEARAV